MSERAFADCVVVGAGFSGVAAATALHREGLEVMVLEARERVGGRTRTDRLDDGTVLDLGGQWIGASHHRLKRLGRSHGAETFEQHAEGSTLIRVGGETIRARGRVPFGLGPVTLVSLGAALLRLDRMARRVPVGEPWSAPHARRWDTQTLESWIERNPLTPSARAVCRSLLTGIFAADPAEVSLLHALVYIHAGEGLDSLTGTAGGAQDSCFTAGMQALAESAARPLGESVRLGQAVRRIRQDGERVLVESDALVVDCERVIVAIPPALAGRIDYSPPMPGVRDQLTQRLPQGSAIKCIGVYERPFWRSEGHSGLVLDTEGPVSMVIDGSTPGRPGGVLIGFLEGGQARRAALLSQEDRRAEVLDCFARHFGSAALGPRHYRDQDWSAEPFTRGCYAGFLPPGIWTSYGRALREPIGRIHWAATETATEWMGYVEGALEAGERAAREVLDARVRTAGEASGARRTSQAAA
jgi:monoamine oxidase